MISTVILYKNEQENLTRCLGSLQWCTDIVVVQDAHDSAPIPHTSNPSVKIVKRLLASNFSAQRAFGMEQANYDWVLFVDADEELSNELIEILQNLSPNPQFCAYAIPRIDLCWGQKLAHGEVANTAQRGILRLVHRKKGVWQGSVHETFIPQGQTGRLNNAILHYPHPTIKEFIHSVNFYSSIRAKELQHKPILALCVELLAYPPAKFFYTYVIRLGFLDGPAGFVYSFMMSFHSFLVRAKAITKTW